MSAAPVKTCPKCTKRKVIRLISQGNFILKGSGWYADLYSSPQPKKESGKSETASEDSKVAKGESKGAKEGVIKSNPPEGSSSKGSSSKGQGSSKAE